MGMTGKNVTGSSRHSADCLDDDGFSLACVAGIDAETALHRLEAETSLR